MDNHAAIDGIKTPMVPPLRTPMNYLYNICHYFYSYSDDWSNSNADRVGEAVRRHWTEICRQWQTVGVLYQTHHGTCMVPSQTAPSAPRSSPDLYITERLSSSIIVINFIFIIRCIINVMARCLFSQWKNNIYGHWWRTTIRQWDNEICTYNTDDDLDHIYMYYIAALAATTPRLADQWACYPWRRV